MAHVDVVKGRAMYPTVKPSASKSVAMTRFIMPLLTEAAKDMLDEIEPQDYEDGWDLGYVEAILCKKIYGKLWKRNKTGLALMLETTGWMRRFVRSSLMAVAKNLRARGDANAE